MELVLLAKPEDAVTEPIQERAKESSKGQLTKQYAVWENGEEVALLSLDYYPRDEYPEWKYPRDKFPRLDRLDIYEIFVPEQLRNRGIGTRILALAEQYARELGLRKTQLHAKPLFNTRTQEEMIDWYKRRGYQMVPGQNDPRELGKAVKP
jgi:GNAT superfamily N-acetyltransferase